MSKIKSQTTSDTHKKSECDTTVRKKHYYKIKVRYRFYKYIYNYYRCAIQYLIYLRYRLYRFLFFKYRNFIAYIIRLRYRFIRRLRFRYIRLLVYVGFRLWLKEIYNFENLPQKGPAIIVSNHASYYDWSVLSAVYNRRYIVFLGARELLKRPLVSWLMKLNILIFIDREHPGYSYFKEVVRRLKEDYIVVIYPEGKRSETGRMIDPKPGFVKLAMHTEVPVIPIGMKGTYKILPPHKKIPRLCKCEIFVEKPLLVNESNPIFADIFSNEKDNKRMSNEAVKKIAIRIMDKIAKRVGQQWDESVDKSYF